MTGTAVHHRRPAHRTDWAGRSATLTLAVAALAVVLTGTRFEVARNVTAGTAAAIALTPVWLPTMRRFTGAITFAVISTVALGFGVWLHVEAKADHAVSQTIAIFAGMLLVSTIASVGVLVWARTLMRPSTVAMLYAVGLLIDAPGAERLAESPWRFAFGVPLTIVALAVAWRLGKRWLEVLITLVLAAVSAAAGGRSLFAMLLMAAVLVLWQAPPRRIGARASQLRTVGLLALAGTSLYLLGQSLAVEGYLGEAAQERTEVQLQTSGSLILGGRPELGATLALLQHYPTGFGLGVRATMDELLVAKSGMVELNYDPDNGYVERYMFGSGIELHSVWADMWADYGLAGVLLGGIVLWLVVRRLSTDLARRQASALLVYLAVQTGWNLFFSPRYSSVPLLILAVGLLLPDRDERPEDLVYSAKT